MEQIIKAEYINLTKLNLAEYGNFTGRVIKYIEQTGPRQLYIDEAVVSAFKANQLVVTDMQDINRKRTETQELQRLHLLRNQLLVYSFRYIRTQRTSPVEAQRQAAAYLYPLMKQCKSSKRIPRMQQSVKIASLLMDLAKPEQAVAVTTLGMTAVFEELQQANDAYNATQMARQQAQIAAKQIPAKLVRQEMDQQYDYCITKAFAAHTLHPTEESRAFVTNVNQLIRNARTAYKLRKGASAAWKKRKEGEEKGAGPEGKSNDEG